MTGTDVAARPDDLATPGGTAGVPIEMVGLGRDFGSVQALADVNMSVRPGEIVALLGPSGSGKSTLLRICAGLESASSGRLLFAGVDQAGIAPHQRDVSLVFQHYALYPHLSALDNLTLALRYGRRQPKKAAVARARETLDMLGIGALADRRPAQMSGGQRQRVAIGRALARQSRVVLLDEPMSGLDAKLRVELRVEIVALLRRLGSTALFVTHDQAEAMAVGDRVAVLNAGRLEQLGTPDEVYDRPATRFVATFVGSPPMNVLDGTLSGGVLSGPGFAVAAPAGATSVGVRPEGLIVSSRASASAVPAGDTDLGSGPGLGSGSGLGGGAALGGDGTAPADGILRLDGTVVVSERLGAERVIYVQTPSGPVAVRVPTDSPAQPGRSVILTASAATCAFFGPDGVLLPAQH
ncbi:ABC transporter ATP-binding protein [Pseudofrankia inefficax]|uniref:ABC transporter related protein n=1 Tax=Pseudofrankia inefficax (strain DSM 45817 / CECT 9037 / DDB 130130 / EuI1c) TaxID=298654 RepID=E3J5T4_PSEI1|nr:ABC transporter ATP-binding protein [Pseudofrankia inefficax]ADP84315.1 ABC transporter related protein [Pseudofrankia inefficax]